jgi:glutamate dehydrogenase/leucine dehydrogenase
MDARAQARLDQFMHGLKPRNPGEQEFHQAVYEFAVNVIPFIQDKPIYQEAQILERLTESDRIVSFRVCWEDDKGNTRANRGYRVQHNNAIGPYKGGIRFHRDLTLSILKFLAFEQTIKNSLTGLPMGGAKGGSNFNPKGKSDREVMRFCQAFMTELSRHIGPNSDGINGDKLEYIKELKNVKRGRISEYAKEHGVKYYKGKRPWAVPCELAFPCATQNEMNGEEAETLVKNGCIAVSEGANMPTEQVGIDIFQKAKIMFAPSKGANIAGFIKVADAMIACGIV